MKTFKSFLNEEAEGTKLKHITHAEDHPIHHGAAGFKHASDVLTHAHNHIKSGGHSSALTMKYDGSPSIVVGHHPETGKFFVASKSAFNVNPKINYTHKDIEKNHGHAPGLAEKLHAALNHLKKVVPKTGVYQGDLMFSEGDKKETKKGVSFTPNTITYTAKGDQADKVRKAKVGVVFHTQYHGKDIHSMSSDPHPDLHNFSHHPDVWMKSPNFDTRQVHYSEKDQEEFKHHMAKAHEIHEKHGKKMYAATSPHQGEGNHLETYINSTVRTGEKPTAKGLKKHIAEKYKKAAAKLKTPAAQAKKEAESKSHAKHIEANEEHYGNLLAMHHHLQQAKNVLVHTLSQHEGGLEHHINGKKTGPEGFVFNHKGPTKLVNREEFAKQNFAKNESRKKVSKK
jgi:hypothetical protein